MALVAGPSRTAVLVLLWGIHPHGLERSRWSVVWPRACDTALSAVGRGRSAVEEAMAGQERLAVMCRATELLTVARDYVFNKPKEVCGTGWRK